MNRQEANEIEERAKETFAAHVIRDAPSRSFFFHTPGKGSAYSFSITWKPGVLTLSGDCGDMMLTHGAALSDFWDGMLWATSDAHYLLGKSNHRRKYDAEDTLRTIVQDANERARDSLKGVREMRREHRERLVDLNLPREVATWEDADEHGPFWEPLPEECALVVRYQLRTSSHDPWLDEDDYCRLYSVEPWRRRAMTRGGDSSYQKTKAPDGWEMWHKLREELCDHLEHNAIFTIAGRQQIKEELASHLENQSAAAELCSKLGFDDYYGSDDYDFHSRWCIAALMHGCSMIVETMPTRVKLARWVRRKREWARSFRRYPFHIRPKLFIHDPEGPNKHFGKKTYTPTARKNREGKPYTWWAEVQPVKWQGRRVPGLWRENGCGGGDGTAWRTVNGERVRVPDMVEYRP